MKFWENFSSFDLANEAWNKKQACLEAKNSLKKILFQPKTKINFSKSQRIRSFFYLLKQDKEFKLFKYFLRKPLFYLSNLLKSYLIKKPYNQKNALFFYNLNNFNDLNKKALDKNCLFIFGFSYCQKPLKCPKKRFSSDCIYDYQNDTCLQCFIGKCANAINKTDIFLVIPDVYFIGKKIFEITHKNPHKEIIFVISACELSIKMFSDYANMLKIKGLGVKLTNRVCLNYQSFLYAEKGKKNGLTDLESKNKDIFLEILKSRYEINPL